MNEEAIKKFEWNNTDGKKFMTGREGGYDVVGTTQNFYVNSMHTEIDPVALIYDPDYSFNVLSVRLSPGKVGEYMNSIKQVWKNFAPNGPMNFTFYDDQFQAMYSKEESIAIALTCMGILGQIFMICLNRIKEIGIRKVNGARISEVITMLNRDFVKWVAIAFVIATPIAYYAMTKWLENFAYKTELSWWIFALAGLLALGIALLTVSWQSWKAATRNPVEALRYE
jgi:putative ABC transport system permease protein